ILSTLLFARHHWLAYRRHYTISSSYSFPSLHTAGKYRSVLLFFIEQQWRSYSSISPKAFQRFYFNSIIRPFLFFNRILGRV
ncbi:MAG TPA: hypothetical protein VKF38_15360, partial [Anaerolineaceae bacterium]|nr:hypothetical protein [Anaerolineaceae bacterium]